MRDVIQFSGYIGSAHYSAEDDCFFGKIEGINDLVTFEGRDVKELRKAFKDAVQDYKDLCKKTGKSPFKSYKGSFNIRISPELHRKAVIKSKILGISLNQLVQKAIEKEIRD